MWLACFKSKTDLSVVSVLLSPVQENEMHCILQTMMAVFPFFSEMGGRGAFSVKYAPYQLEHIV